MEAGMGKVDSLYGPVVLCAAEVCQSVLYWMENETHRSSSSV
jgi:hypothetical protein